MPLLNICLVPWRIRSHNRPVSMNLVHSSTLGDGGAFESCLDFSPPPDRQGSSRTPWAPPHVPKRSKVSLACHTCRRRKKRCDGLWPSCTPCKRRPDGWKCQYPEKTITGKAYGNTLCLVSRIDSSKGLFLRAYNSLDPILRLLLEVNLDLYQQWY